MNVSMDVLRRFETTAPPQRLWSEEKPTLLVCWWCTFYSLTIIIIRVCGRYFRAEKIFLADRVIILAIVPLLARMGFAHVVLLYGTNNIANTGLTAVEIKQRELGSQLVLASRIFYAAYLWMIKYSVSIYLRSLTEAAGQKSHQRTLHYFHVFLVVTFAGTVIGDLAACQPFSHYWQVVPDPGPQCRMGYAQLFTTGILNALTNIILVVLPMPIILRSSLSRSRKFSILVRMGLPLTSVILTIVIIPSIIAQDSSQRFRTLLASFDILLATFTSNAIVLGSLLQDRGYKKSKYKHGDARDGFGTKTTASRSRGKDGLGVVTSGITTKRESGNRWGSDEDLMRTSSGDAKMMEISLEELSPDGLSKSDELAKPGKAKFPEIRVNSTWEIHINDRDVDEEKP